MREGKVYNAVLDIQQMLEVSEYVRAEHNTDFPKVIAAFERSLNIHIFRSGFFFIQLDRRAASHN